MATPPNYDPPPFRNTIERIPFDETVTPVGLDTVRKLVHDLNDHGQVLTNIALVGPDLYLIFAPLEIP